MQGEVSVRRLLPVSGGDVHSVTIRGGDSPTATWFFQKVTNDPEGTDLFVFPVGAQPEPIVKRESFANRDEDEIFSEFLALMKKEVGYANFKTKALTLRSSLRGWVNLDLSD